MQLIFRLRTNCVIAERKSLLASFGAHLDNCGGACDAGARTGACNGAGAAAASVALLLASAHEAGVQPGASGCTASPGLLERK